MNFLTSRGLWPATPAFVPNAIDPTWPLDRRLFELLAPKAPGFISECQAVVRVVFLGKEFLPADLTATETEQAFFIDSLIPPGEHVGIDGSAAPFSPESIINSCWLFWAGGAASWVGLGGPERKRDLLSRLMFKALESSRIRRML